MYYECCVCKTSRQDAILHHFPCTEKRLQKWLKCLASTRNDLKALTSEQLSKLFVCSKHFEKRFITEKSRLLGHAYPTLFTAVEISSGVPSRADGDNVDSWTDHTYSRTRHFDHTYAKRDPLRELPENAATTTSSLLDIPGASQHLSIKVPAHYADGRPVSNSMTQFIVLTPDSLYCIDCEIYNNQ